MCSRTIRYLSITLMLLGSLLASLPAYALDLSSPGPEAEEKASSQFALRLGHVELSGATRTSLSTVYRYLDLFPGQLIDQKTLVQAVESLRDEELFESVSFYTKPGKERGQLVLVLEVQETGFDFRWAAGNTDIDGWYLVPAMLAYDNAFGKGGDLDLRWQIGFRHNGLLLRYRQPRAGDGRSYWGARLGLISTDWVYSFGGVEFLHRVKTAGLETVYGRRYAPHRLFELGLKIEEADAVDYSIAQNDSPDGSLAFEDRIEGADLPQAIQKNIGSAVRTILHADWQFDTRSTETKAGTPVSGVWGRLKGKFTLLEGGSFPGIRGDLRAYKEVPGGVLAARLQGAWVGKRAAFYDRLYLGGMYTVRGFSTNSLSAPGGDTWLLASSLEYRSSILNDKKGSKLAGIFFLDSGLSGSPESADPYKGLAVGVGYGLQWRVWWLDWVGVNIGFPVTERPLDIRFQGTASIGWSF